jgi:formylglycine-generating enzyme required for sulfatase activity
MTSKYVLRGGSWLLYSGFCRSAERDGLTPVNRDDDLGFRVLRSSEVDNKPRVNRGGSWINYPDYCRSAIRNWNTPDDRDYILGFRVIKENKHDE